MIDSAECFHVLLAAQLQLKASMLMTIVSAQLRKTTTKAARLNEKRSSALVHHCVLYI
jgi:hypothetical protein